MANIHQGSIYKLTRLWKFCQSKSTSRYSAQSCSSYGDDIKGLAQDCSISSANALEILQPCARPLLYLMAYDNKCNPKANKGLNIFLFNPSMWCLGSYRYPYNEHWWLKLAINEFSFNLTLCILKLNSSGQQHKPVQDPVSLKVNSSI